MLGQHHQGAEVRRLSVCSCIGVGGHEWVGYMWVCYDLWGSSSLAVRFRRLLYLSCHQMCCLLFRSIDRELCVGGGGFVSNAAPDQTFCQQFVVFLTGGAAQGLSERCSSCTDGHVPETVMALQLEIPCPVGFHFWPACCGKLEKQRRARIRDAQEECRTLKQRTATCNLDWIRGV